MIVNSPSDFDFLEIGLASPDRIRFWSYGEVEKPETINYRTFKPERKGLFCERIFGPIKDWECACGKYRRVRYRGIVCERCGVEVTHSKVRRERMGHLELAADVCHIWFLKGIPSYIGLLLDMSSRQLEEVIYYDSYIITQVDDSLSGVLEVGKIISTIEHASLRDEHGNKFKADMGASAIKTLLSQLNLQELALNLREAINDSKGQKRLKFTKRLRVVESLFKSGNRPEWMILEAMPVMPPDLRPMVQLEGGRFATSDLNDLYRRVVNRNNRLKRLIDIGAPEMIIRNEKRMLQEAVDVLISNGKRGRSVTGSNGRPLKSLGNIIEGKQGRFRQNLLGKRVDYSARSVIVVGPHLKFHQCGLPKEMALELFKPFIIRKLVEYGHVTNVKSAKKKIERREVVVWDVLEEIIKGQPVLLNRAPTLHRLGIQAFEPILVEGSAIQIHPLVCTAFNADFDGDQMAVHVPLSLEAQAECRLLIMSTNNILSPANGRSIVTPTQDMVLGCYFLTIENPSLKYSPQKYFGTIDEAFRAWEARSLSVQSRVLIRLRNKEKVETTMGRVIFNRRLWEVFDEYGIDRPDFINETIGKKQLGQLVFDWYHQYGNDVIAKVVDRLKTIGFRYSTLSGISISVDDLIIPSKKQQYLENASKQIDSILNLEEKGAISSRERQLRSNDVWRETTHNVSNSLSEELGELNNVYIMANSGARGNMDQVRQLSGMRGLMSDAQGRTVDIPIKSNFKEGLSLTEYFISSYGARKGLVDTALRTADSGYLTRRLVDVAQDVMITEEDCGVNEGVDIQAIKDGINIIVPISEMIEGRFSIESVKHPETKEELIRKDELITPVAAKAVEDAGIKILKVRSISRCQSERGLCQRCYGLDLASGHVIDVGEAVGIIAAQSIGEPGTQLTMRTFHTGGVDLRKASKVEIKSKKSGVVSFPKELGLGKVNDEVGSSIWVSTREGNMDIVNKKDKRSYLIPSGSTILVKDGDDVEEGDVLAEYDPSFEYVISASEGIVSLVGVDILEHKDAQGKVIDTVGRKDGEVFIHNPKIVAEFVIPEKYAKSLKEGQRIKSDTELAPECILETGGIITDVSYNKSKTEATVKISPGESYPVLSGTTFFVAQNSNVKPGVILARERIGGADASKTKDIVQGLPRVEELFEARKPKDSAVLSGITGVIDIHDEGFYRIISVIGKEDKCEYKIPYGIRLKVYTGKQVHKGDMLTDGVINPHDVLETKGVVATQNYLCDEVQRVYRSQGVSINTKHIEVIVRQMIRKVNVTTMGDTDLLPNDLVDIKLFEKENRICLESDKQTAIGERVLLGITRSSLNTESFISASSFQQTASVLTRAAIEGQTDPMYGLKENVIIGKLIPAGTGMQRYGAISLNMNVEEEAQEEILEEMLG